MARAILMTGGGSIFSADMTATADKVLTGYTYCGNDTNDEIGTGSMPNRGAVSQALNCGGSYTVPAGYHNGSGIVSANSLASQTVADAVAASIRSGKTAWVNGSKITGTIADQTGGTYNPNNGSVKTLAYAGKYLTSDVKVNGFSLPAAANLKKGVTFSLYGQSVSGTLGVDYNLIRNCRPIVTWSNYTMGQGSFFCIGQGSIAYTSSKISLAPYSKLWVKIISPQYDASGDRFYQAGHFGLTFGIGESASTFKTSSSPSTPGYAPKSIDISGYTGSYYIMIKAIAPSSYAQSGSKMIVENCYLEM